MELKKCHYCGSEPKQSTKQDFNVVGERGYKSTVRCFMCDHHQVEIWARTYLEAERKAKAYWNGGVDNG